jgi:hypothetical protein
MRDKDVKEIVVEVLIEIFNIKKSHWNGEHTVDTTPKTFIEKLDLYRKRLNGEYEED